MSAVHHNPQPPAQAHQNETGWFSKQNLIVAAMSLSIAAIGTIACEIFMNMNPPCSFEYRSENGDILEIFLDEGSCAELGRFFNR